MRAAARRDDAACPRGERMKATTKDNLAWRVDCEFGATQGKFDLAVCAKKNGLDAIHDTVHEYGVYAQTVKNNPDISEEDKKYIFDQLMANFTGECSEVGMYLCMARIAHREGYPEIGLYWEKAAWEEAEHAAKFAELLGSTLEPNMKATTKDNLAWRVECEFGATNGKFELASCAKRNGLDAIHDTVHEMARDEARHGRGLEGLLKRYF